MPRGKIAKLSCQAILFYCFSLLLLLISQDRPAASSWTRRWARFSSLITAASFQILTYLFTMLLHTIRLCIITSSVLLNNYELTKGVTEFQKQKQSSGVGEGS